MKKKANSNYFVNENALLLIGSKMRVLRKEKGVSIEMLANTWGMDYSQLARMEGGKINFTISYLFREAEALGVTPKDLLP